MVSSITSHSPGIQPRTHFSLYTYIPWPSVSHNAQINRFYIVRTIDGGHQMHSHTHRTAQRFPSVLFQLRVTDERNLSSTNYTHTHTHSHIHGQALPGSGRSCVSSCCVARPRLRLTDHWRGELFAACCVLIVRGMNESVDSIGEHRFG